MYVCIFGHVACGILVPQPGMEPRPLAVKAPSPNYWTAREFSSCFLLILVLVYNNCLKLIVWIPSSLWFLGEFLLVDFSDDSGSHFVLLCTSGNLCIWCWILCMPHCWIFRFCCIPLVSIEVYFRGQSGDLQICLISPRLVSLSVRAVMEQPLVYSYFSPSCFQRKA